MVRPYKVTGQKRKKKEKYDREEEYEQLDDNDIPQSPKKAKTEGLEGSELDKEKAEQVIDEMPRIPIVPTDMFKKSRDIFILERASLEISKVGKSYQLLSSDEHANYLMKNKRKPAEHCFSGLFEAIQTILDSRVNKSGRLKASYVRTQQGILFQIKPHARMPRTYKRFSGLMVQLLQKLHITAAGKGEKLLRVIKNPVTQYLPINSRKIGFSHSSEKLVDMYDYVSTVDNGMDLVFVVGAMAHGKIDKDYVEDYLLISEFPMSAAYCISIITTAVELQWKIL
ncbi:ribosomal RNA small subunit methyltransferase NEP1-like [Olea europaea var. sylvestris]|uniref:ribosomal RNA small subunit methyltransferase NEP1-like n=1 Tax=Olea europaea var. sylvestris TaxID=158386 RepID=UPI000C1D6742|nr:ribosomal RNA small subunit methyltransferase NEP1-like [Olea europaea var. sylvestris]